MTTRPLVDVPIADTRRNERYGAYLVICDERAGRIVGMTSGYTSQQLEQSSEEPLRSAAGFRMVRMAAFSMLGPGMKKDMSGTFV